MEVVTVEVATVEAAMAMATAMGEVRSLPHFSSGQEIRSGDMTLIVTATMTTVAGATTTLIWMATTPWATVRRWSMERRIPMDGTVEAATSALHAA